MTTLTIAGKTVRALRHGMVGQPGWELFGPWDDREAVHEALVAAGEEFGLRRVGGRAYSSNTLESGWIPSPLPAVYSGESLQVVPRVAARRRATRARRRSAAASTPTEHRGLLLHALGSRLRPSRQVRPRLHRPRGARAMVDDDHRQKVTLALDDDDVTRTIGTMLEKRGRAKFIDWPSAVYSMHPFDKVTVDGETVGVSTWIGYSANEGKMLTLAVARRRTRRARHRGDVRLGRAGRRHDASRPSSGMSRRRSARSSARSRTSRRSERITRRAGGAPPRCERAWRWRHVVAAASGTRPRIRSAAFSAIIIVGACVLERVIVGITDASTMRSPSMP